MFDLKSYTTYIEKHLGEIDVPDLPKDLYDPMRYFLTIGGKRIRPILTLLAAELFGTKKETALSPALSIELFHNFTLIHDDIMDNAPIRRNQATIHEKWNTNVGILSGDVLLIKGYQLLSKSKSEYLPELLEIYNNTAIKICEGQQLDMDYESKEDVTIDEYIEMIRLKTSVLLGSALRIGALVAGADAKQQMELENFGENIGLAFQIQDDILDLYADPENFGKQVGGDVIANKKTLLHLTALEKSTAEQREILRQLRNESNIELKITRTKELFDQLNVMEACKNRMQTHFDKAKQAMARIDAQDEKKEALLELATFLMSRVV